MKKQLLRLLVTAWISTLALHADTSYLLIQGDFNNDTTLETYTWQVNYGSNQLSSGQDLLNGVFGTPTDTQTTVTSPWNEFEQLDLWTAGNSTLGIGYTNSPSFGLFLYSITIDSHTLLTTLSNGWNYHVSGGGANYTDENYALIGDGTYPSDGAWYVSGDGATSRTLVDGSYDAWVFGVTYPVAAPVDGSGNLPTTTNFTNATILNVPEPTSTGLLLVGLGMLALRRKRTA